jgi:peptidyl-tRNA hydrolase, PTH1 family
MALFQKKPTFDSAEMPLYSLGQNTTVIIVGLGNPGGEYDDTRHNIGFKVLDHFAQKQGFDNWIQKKDLHCLQASHTIDSTRVILCKPTTFMNESGKAVQAIQHFYKVDNAKTVLVYDEIDIEFGQIRSRIGGGSAGHNGIKSIINATGGEEGRIRIGIGPKPHPEMDTADFVLGKFDQKQTKHMPLLLQEMNAILSEYAHAGGVLQTETRSFIF